MNSTSDKHIAIAQDQPIRLQEYGVGIFKIITSKSALKKVLKKNLIYVNDQVATTATMIYGGEIITLYRPIENQNNRAFILPLEVIFEDDYLAIIHKPAGILISGNTFKTISSALVQNLAKSTQEDATAPKSIHRLDFPTTGTLLVGKTSTSISALSALFETKKISKTYFAVTIGKMGKGKDISLPVDGKSAISTVEIISTIASERFGLLNLVRLTPKTGRRHQLRKHLSALGNPILGDVDYGIEGLILKGKGLYLHAFSLEFIHPNTKKKIYVEKNLPKKFIKLFGIKF